LIAHSGGRRFVELSAISSGVKDVRDVIEAAQQARSIHDVQTVLFIDEVHRFNKSQQDALLPGVENGWITLIAATTENPSFSVNAPLLSRSIVVRLEPLDDHAIEQLIHRALISDRGLAQRFVIEPAALAALVQLASGDARIALTILEATTPIAELSTGVITEAAVEQAAQRSVVRYDKDGDQHYDITSAFIKSMRGSDVDAALHYLARMIAAGEDPRFIARRIVILASEDIGMADPSALQTAIAAHQAVSFIGMPEAQLTLAHAVIHCSLAPKSNSVTRAISAALSDVHRGRGRAVPPALRDAHYPGARALGHGTDYMYPHDVDTGVAQTDYLPEDLRDVRYFQPTMHGQEARWSAIAEHLRHLLRGESVGSPPESSPEVKHRDSGGQHGVS
jgi:putative ATPase